MDLELSDEQVWLEESINTLLDRQWPPADAAWRASDPEREKLWGSLVEFGVIGGGEDQLGAIELCLTARALGSHLASVPFLGSVAVRYALAPHTDELRPEIAELLDSPARFTVALLEPGNGWSLSALSASPQDGRLSAVKAAVEHVAASDQLAVVVRAGDEPSLVLVDGDTPGIEVDQQSSLDESVPLSRVTLDGVPVDARLEDDLGAAVTRRLVTIGGLLAAAEAVGAAQSVFGLARQYAAERRQFGRPIGSNQALRHLMSDLHVRQASSWSTVLYAAAALDDGIPGAQQTASVAKAYVSRAAREVAHGSMQIFGGIAFTQEHPAHRFLRRIVVREQQFGDAAHHERELGRTLAAATARRELAAESAGARSGA